MASEYEKFWQKNSFALVGHSARTPFPELSYKELKKLGRTAYAVDPSADTICGDKAYKDFASLPEPVEAAVLELPKEETESWVNQAGLAGIKDIWIHMGNESQAALEAGKKHGINVLSGTCAVMYLKKNFSYHSLHKGIMKLTKKY